MVNSADFIARLEKILDHYNLSAAAFADKIGVQRSSISHVLTGRNKPSLEFVMKVVRSYPEVNLYWLLNGKGAFPSGEEASGTLKPKNIPETLQFDKERVIRKVLILYEDGSFEAFEK
ncbi:helix-turn-helix domain-containing protein [Muriicola marianensis]|uniref:HTH cro/C1-type domain-containing protein n=1 Tax=Muriicola marianensis TaxID=1324801 RepID=A0ABQ1QQ47_9FLAO|nr:helix-turn-helix transcriptional regulator [Muriicola marianensis]GGD38342.1 hypothetical protein GCM10011361_01830 [Muriicola marianensis]